MTWKDVKLAPLQKCFSAEGRTINESDEAVSEYLNAMPQAANEALAMLCTARRYLRKSASFEKEKESSLTIDLSEIPDFYRIGSPVVYDSGYHAIGCRLVEGKILLVPENCAGPVTVYYDAWPQTLTMDTPDDTELPLDPDVAVLLPLYMASQIYKDDDISISTIYRNEFETAFDRLSAASTGVRERQFRDTVGWL